MRPILPHGCRSGVVLRWLRCAYARPVQRRLILLTGLLAIVAAACGATNPGVTAVGSQRDGGGLIVTESTQPGDTVPVERTYEVIDGVVDFGEAGPQHPEYDGFLTAAFGDIQSLLD